MSDTRFRRALKVWHGSPYDWDKPDLSKVGTGEGAQVYGHGFYVGEAQGTGEEYMRQTTAIRRRKSTGRWLIDGRAFDQTSYDPMKPEEFVLAQLSDGRSNALKKLESAVVDNIGNPTHHDQLREAWHGRKKWLDENKHRLSFDRTVNKTPGRLYELELDLEPHEVLDWDEDVRNHDPGAKKKLGQMLQDHYQKESAAGRGGLDPSDWDIENVSMDGHGFYRWAEQAHGSPAKASEALKAAGIQAIRYKDQQSRGQVKHLTSLDPDDQEMLGKINDALGPGPLGYQKHRLNDIMDFVKALADEAQNESHFGRFKSDPAEKTESSRRMGELIGMTNWIAERQHRLEVGVKPPTYNYVVLDPSRIRVLRKYGIKGQLVEDLTQSKGPVVLTAQPGRPEED